MIMNDNDNEIKMINFLLSNSVNGFLKSGVLVFR